MINHLVKTTLNLKLLNLDNCAKMLDVFSIRWQESYVMAVKNSPKIRKKFYDDAKTVRFYPTLWPTI